MQPYLRLPVSNSPPTHFSNQIAVWKTVFQFPWISIARRASMTSMLRDCWLVAWLLFYAVATAFQSYNGSTNSVLTLVLFLVRQPPMRLTSTLSVHIFASNWQQPFLTQRKWENDCRNYFMLIFISINKCGWLGIQLATLGSAVIRLNCFNS